MDKTKISEDKTIDEKVENILRTIQEQIIKFYITEVNNSVNKSNSLLSEVSILKTIHAKLESIQKICSNELADIEQQLDSETDADTRILYSKAIADINIMIVDLKKYINNLSFTISLIERKLTSDDALKKGLKEIINNLQIQYDSFINADKDLITILSQIIKKNKLA